MAEEVDPVILALRRDVDELRERLDAVPEQTMAVSRQVLQALVSRALTFPLNESRLRPVADPKTLRRGPTIC